MGKSNSPILMGHNEFTWDQVLQPKWGTTPGQAANPAKLVSIQFHVVSPSSGTAPLDFDFCISNLTLLQ
jgi:NADH:ubiquinone oxidoreductase subunit B-like Fe-S oxidoreductase